MKRLFSWSWPVQELSNNVLRRKERKLDQRKPRNHTNTQILIMYHDTIKYKIRKTNTPHKIHRTKKLPDGFYSCCSLVAKDIRPINRQNKIQRRFLLFEGNLLSPFFTLIIKSKFKEEKKLLHLIPCNLQLVMTSFSGPQMAWWEFFNARVAFALRTLWSVRENQLNHFQALKRRCPTRYKRRWKSLSSTVDSSDF